LFDVQTLNKACARSDCIAWSPLIINADSMCVFFTMTMKMKDRHDKEKIDSKKKLNCHSTDNSKKIESLKFHPCEIELDNSGSSTDDYF
jgi:hypothetical protein